MTVYTSYVVLKVSFEQLKLVYQSIYLIMYSILKSIGKVYLILQYLFMILNFDFYLLYKHLHSLNRLGMLNLYFFFDIKIFDIISDHHLLLLEVKLLLLDNLQVLDATHFVQLL